MKKSISTKEQKVSEYNPFKKIKMGEFSWKEDFENSLKTDSLINKINAEIASYTVDIFGPAYGALALFGAYKTYQNLDNPQGYLYGSTTVLCAGAYYTILRLRKDYKKLIRELKSSD